MKNGSKWLRAMFCVVAASCASAAIAADASDLKKQQERAREAIAAEEWNEARSQLESLLDEQPNDQDALYDLAVVEAQLGNVNESIRRLIQAFQSGFIDFDRLERDARLDPLRESREFQAILNGRGELLDARADVNEDSLRKLLGKGYTYQRNAELRLIIASSFNPRSTEVALEEINDVASWAYANVFEAPAPDDSAAPPWVSVILPTSQHFAGFMMMLGAGPNVGGLYDHNRSQLICQDIGPSLRHEFLHVLHWRILSQTGQAHPDWIMEGLGTLIEDVDPDPDSPGGFIPAPSWRTNIAKRLLDLGRLMPLDDLTTMDRRVFRTRRPNANYAQARAFVMFIHDQGLLRAFFDEYVATNDQDPTGVLALETAFDLPLSDIESAYRVWLDALPEAPESIRSGMASLGVFVGAGRGDGPVIDEVVAGSRAGGSGLRLRDVILSVDGRSTRTLPDLVRVLSQYEPGDRVDVEVRRGARRLTFEVELVER